MRLGGKNIERDAKGLRTLIYSTQAPALTIDHGALLGLDHDDHLKYLHLDVERTITAQHSFAPAVVRPPFVLGANAQGQLVPGLQADQLSKQVKVGQGLTGGGKLTADVTVDLADSVAGSGLNITNKVLAVGQGDGLTVTADAVALTTPGSCTVASGNSAAGNHTHAITSSADPGAGASLLASDPAGGLALRSLRLKYDVSNYADLLISSGGNLTLAPTGDIILDPTGADVLPDSNYRVNLGMLSQKYLTLHAAELWVETLVAQNTIATIGGRILVGPTTTLHSNLAPAATSMYVEHNQMQPGDIVYLEADGKVEFMRILSGPVDYTTYYGYGVVRNLDGSGANQWYAGDAVFNTGTTGDGFIDLYSLQGVLSRGIGPTIVGNVRNTNTYNDYDEHWAIGNLNGLYGYGSNVYGVAAGKYSPTTSWLAADATNGVRMMRGDTQLARWYINGDILVGQQAVSQANVLITAGALKLRNNTTDKIVLDADGSASFEGVINLGTSGGIFQGTGTFAAPTTALKIFNSGGVGLLELWGSGTKQVYASTDGKLYAGGGDIKLDSTGITVTIQDASASRIYWNRAGTNRANIYAWYNTTLGQGLLGLDASAMGASGIIALKAAFTYFYDEAGGLMGRIDTGDGFFFNYDILSGGGIVSGTTGINPTTGDLVYTANLRPYRNSTQYTAYAFVPLTAPLTNTSWDGDAKNIGSYAIDTSVWGAPVGIKAALVRVSATWAAAATGNYAAAKRLTTDTNHAVIARSMVASFYNDQMGVVPCDANGDFSIEIAGANAAGIYVQIWGYYI